MQDRWIQLNTGTLVANDPAVPVPPPDDTTYERYVLWLRNEGTKPISISTEGATVATAKQVPVGTMARVGYYDLDGGWPSLWAEAGSGVRFTWEADRIGGSPGKTFLVIPCHVDAHAASHEDGGTDEISVDGLVGTLAWPQNADHINGVEVSSTPSLDHQIFVFNEGTGAIDVRLPEEMVVHLPMCMTLDSVVHPNLTNRNDHQILSYDDGSGFLDETAYCQGVMPHHFDDSVDVRVELHWTSVNEPANMVWEIAWERNNAGSSPHNVDADSFGPGKTCTAPGSGALMTITVFTCDSGDLDLLDADELYRLLVRRLSSNAGDVLVGDVQLHAVHIYLYQT